MESPKLMIDRKTYRVSKDKYLFISYSHRNSELVYPLLARLYDKGINFWYDKELNMGEAWNDAARKAMLDDNCIGVLFFVSEPFINSDACQQEIHCARNILEKRHDFNYYPIYLEKDKSYREVIKKSDGKFDGAKEDILNLFADNIIYQKVNFEDLDKTSEDIYYEIKKRSIKAINNQESYLNLLLAKNKIKQVGDSYQFKYGTYPQDETAVLKKVIKDEDVYDFDGNKYRGNTSSRAFYPYLPLSFKIISISEGIIYAIPIKAIEICLGNDSKVSETLQYLKENCFNKKEFEALVEIKELSLDIIKKDDSLITQLSFEPTKYIFSKNSLASSSFFILDNDIRKIYAMNGTNINMNYNSNRLEASLIPVICVDLNKFIGE